MIGRSRTSGVHRIGLLGLEPFVMAQVSRVEPQAEVVVLQAAEIFQLDGKHLDVVVLPGEHPQRHHVVRHDPSLPTIVISEEPGPAEPGVIQLRRPASSPELQQAFDQALGRPLWQRLYRSLRVEQDDRAGVERLAFLARTVAAVVSIAFLVVGGRGVPLWVLGLLATHAILRASWWRLTPPAVMVDVAVAVTVAAVSVHALGETSLLAVALPVVVWVEVGYVLGWSRGFGVVAGSLGIVGIVGLLVYGDVLVALNAAVGALAVAILSILAGAMASRIAGDRDRRRRFHLERFRSALYELAERQAVVAVSFDLLTAAEDVLARLLRQADPRAAIVLVRDRGGPLLVAAGHNLLRPPPARFMWTRSDASLHPANAMLVDVATTTTTAAPDPAQRDGQHPDPPMVRSGAADVPEGAAVAPPTPEELVATVADQLRDYLPAGDVTALPAVVEGEVLGGLVMVDPSDRLSPGDLEDMASEAALAFDSVRLFNRLRAFTLDQERARIGRSLHDGVMQTLGHVAFQLDMAVRDGEVVVDAQALADLRDDVRSTLGEMRTVVNDLRSVRLDRGLQSALRTMGATMAPAGGPVIMVECDPVDDLDPEVEEQFLRIAEEAIANAVRHAKATTVTVTLRLVDDQLVLQVSDDGVGFGDVTGTTAQGGVGLTSIRQRASAIGAGLDVDRGPGAILTVTHAVRRRYTLDGE